MVKLDQLFYLKNGIASSNLEVCNQKVSEDHVLYLRPSQNQLNVIAGYVDKTQVPERYIFGKDTIYVSTDGEGSHTYAYVSTGEFVPNSNVAVLLPKDEMTLSEKLCYSMAITANRYKFSYGIKPKGVRLKNVRLPDLKEIPSFVTTIPIPPKPSEKALSPGKKISLRDRRWKKFYYDDIFNISKGQRLIEEDREKGQIAYFSASETNNGCTDFISNPLFTKRNAILYSTFGDAYWVKGEFTASDEISIFQNDHLNVYNALFITTVMAQNRYKYTFGRKAFRIRFTNDTIKLPVDTHEKPDWQFMEDYIKSLPYSAELATSA